MCFAGRWKKSGAVRLFVNILREEKFGRLNLAGKKFSRAEQARTGYISPSGKEQRSMMRKFRMLAACGSIRGPSCLIGRVVLVSTGKTGAGLIVRLF